MVPVCTDTPMSYDTTKRPHDAIGKKTSVVNEKPKCQQIVGNLKHAERKDAF